MSQLSDLVVPTVVIVGLAPALAQQTQYDSKTDSADGGQNRQSPFIDDDSRETQVCGHADESIKTRSKHVRGKQSASMAQLRKFFPGARMACGRTHQRSRALIGTGRPL